MKRKNFFEVCLSCVVIATVVFLTGTVYGLEDVNTLAGKEAIAASPHRGDVIQKYPAEAEKKTAEKKSGHEPGSSSRNSNFPEYKDPDAPESYGSPYWGYMRDN